jgi:predicted phosphodiesterase
LLLVGLGSAEKTDGVPRQFTIIPYVTSTDQNSSVIHWYPQTFIPDELFYANESFYNKTGSYDHSVRVNNTFLPHKISLKGLESGTRYHYALQQDGTTVINHSFRTFAEKGACSFIVYGDTREQMPYFTQLERHRIVANRIAGEPNISFVINTGDLVNNPDDPEEWDRFFTAGKMLFATTTYAAVRGNHDSNSSFSNDFFGTDWIYSIDCGDAHIAILDSTDYAHLSLAEQARWLKTDLESADTWKIVILHHPLYTSEENHFGGFENLQKAFEPVFLSENVSVVFNGHVHAFERIEKSGIMYFTEGRGGAPAYRLNETKMEGSVRNMENSLGYSRVTIDPENGTLRIDVIRVAEISPDLRNVTQIFTNTVIDSIEFNKYDQLPRRISSLKPFQLLSVVFSCDNNSGPSGQIPFCILDGLLE